MRGLKLTALVATSLAAAALWGCGSNLDSANDQGEEVPITSARTVGINTCVVCHNDGGPQLPKWLESGHGNAVNSPFDLNSLGVPDYAMIGTDPSCPTCHDPQGDGQRLTSDLTGNVPRPVVGCEACHGGGQYHNGLGPIPYPSPSHVQCGACHNQDFPHPADFPFGVGLVENYEQSKHADSVMTVASRCTRCHTDEGFRTYVAATRDFGHDAIEDFFADKAVPSSVTSVECRTCHDGHSGALRAEAITEDVSEDPEAPDVRTVYSRQFRLCTSCHQVFLVATFDPEAGFEGQGAYTYELDEDIYGAAGSPGEAEYHNPIINSRGSYAEVITDTHFPGSYLRAQIDENGDVVTDEDGNPVPEEAPVTVVGYNINAGDEKACTICHDAHGATKFEQEGVSEVAEAWGNNPGAHGDYVEWPYEQRTSCAKCHSGTEFVKLTVGGTERNFVTDESRVVACVSCHDLQAKDDEGAFALGPTRVIDPVVFPSGVEVTLGNASNLCATCHQGRESGVSVQERLDTEDAPYDFINIHYFAAAATYFGSQVNGGYEYPGLEYVGRNVFPSHPDGLKDCIGCHLRGEADHNFLPKIEDCNGCHRIEGLPVAEKFEELPVSPAKNFADIQALSGDLIAAIQSYATNVIATGIYYDGDAYPYFFKEGGPAERENGYDLFDAKLLAAAYNYQVAQKDPCGYLHNGTYIKQLLYDSIQDLGQEVTPSIPVPGRDGFRGATPSEQWHITGHADSGAEPFIHWDEDDPPEVPTSCAKCHTTPGFADFALDGVVDEAVPVGSVVECSACHQRRNLFADPSTRWETTANVGLEPVTFPSGATATFENNSNICMACHQGRESGVSVQNRVSTQSPPYNFINRHYLAAAAILFGSDVTASYEYAGKTYRGQNTYSAGMAARGLDNCVGCHMQRGAVPPLADHRFLPDVSDCNLCHSDFSAGAFGAVLTDFDKIAYPDPSKIADIGGDPSAVPPNVDYDGDGILEGFRGEIDGMQAALLAAIQGYARTTLAKPIAYSGSSYPYWFNDLNDNGVVDPEEEGSRYNSFDAKLLQGAFNYHSNQDPCGPFHNHKYVIQTDYNAIEDLGGSVEGKTRP